MTTDSGVPLDKIADFGAHADRYYQIPHSIFKSELEESMFEFLWNQYWVQTLSSNGLEVNRSETTRLITDTSGKLRKYFSNPKAFRHEKKSGSDERGGGKSKKDSEVSNIVAASTKTSLERTHQWIAEVMKGKAFGKAIEPEESKGE